ncbi:Phosphatidylglycerophosphatase and protein-tyrosine phosphatase 1 [Entomortierella beljakovae]|nr:Phosphatidylglycerophosphatase and protein-tyrosine phosphatase 1 [Entomortierella beljakovae]
MTLPRVQTMEESENALGIETRDEPELDSGSGIKIYQTAQKNDPFQGDGVDPSQADQLIPQRTVLEWVAYSVSLNYNRLATSVLFPVTRWQWHNTIPHTNIILGAVPTQQLLKQLHQERNLQNVVNMCAEFKGHLDTMKDLGITQCWIPTRDFHTPSLENIWIGVRFMSKCQVLSNQQEVSEPTHLYIHCKAGRGRSATVALCWLAFVFKLTIKEAQNILLEARGQASHYQNTEFE